MQVIGKKFALYSLFMALLLFGQASLKQLQAQNATNDIIYTRADLENYIGKWQRADGAAVGIISDYFCYFFMAEPKLFLEVMSEHPNTYNEWLHDLPGHSLTDYGGCTNVECVRTGMLETLDLVDLPEKLQPMAERLKGLLKKTKIERIE